MRAARPRQRLAAKPVHIRNPLSLGHDLRQVMGGVLQVEYVPAPFAFLYRTMLDEAAPMRCRVDCGKILVDRGGYVATTPAAADSYKQLESMTVAELEAHLHKLEASMKDVTPATATDDDSTDDAPADDTPPQPH
jgi:hypothetical protein